MKYRCIKRIIDRICSNIEGIRRELIMESFFSSLLHCGTNTQVYDPFIITNPDRVSLGNNVTILENSRIQTYDRGVVSIGDGCYIGYRFTILAGGDVIVGNNVLIASDVGVFSENHGMDPLIDDSYMHQSLICEDVYIGEGCWIGESVKILPGVKIGERSIIGAGSVVTRAIPAYCIAAGNPARVVKTFNQDTKEWEKVAIIV